MLLDLNFRILAQPDVKNTFGPATSPAKLRMKLRKSRVSRCFLKADLDATLVQSNQGPVQLGYSRLLHRCHNVKMIMAPWFDSKDRVPGVWSDCGSTGSGSALIRYAFDIFWYPLVIFSTTVHPKLEQVWTNSAGWIAADSWWVCHSAQTSRWGAAIIHTFFRSSLGKKHAEPCEYRLCKGCIGNQCQEFDLSFVLRAAARSDLAECCRMGHFVCLLLGYGLITW